MSLHQQWLERDDAAIARRWPAVIFRRRRIQLLESVHEGVLGTQLSLQVRDPKASTLRRVERRLLEEIDRLESVFSVYRPDSELSRWKVATGSVVVSAELAQLLRVGLEWHERSAGVFNPSVGQLSALWQDGARRDALPEADEIAALAESMIAAPYANGDGQWIKVGDCTSLNFNALAKGMLIDLATQSVVAEFSPLSIVVNVGGDLVHRGAGAMAVRVEDPHRPFDNAPPLDSVFVANAGVATSGLTKRGVRIGGRWFSHVIDPRTGWPVDSISSATVVADDAATADAIATVLSVLTPPEGVEFADGCGADVACLIVGADRCVATNAAWDRRRQRPDSAQGE
jgi:FAD:protein FMN transferase